MSTIHFKGFWYNFLSDTLLQWNKLKNPEIKKKKILLRSYLFKGYNLLSTMIHIFNRYQLQLFCEYLNFSIEDLGSRSYFVIVSQVTFKCHSTVSLFSDNFYSMSATWSIIAAHNSRLVLNSAWQLLWNGRGYFSEL